MANQAKPVRVRQRRRFVWPALALLLCTLPAAAQPAGPIPPRPGFPGGSPGGPAQPGEPANYPPNAQNGGMNETSGGITLNFVNADVRDVAKAVLGLSLIHI